MSGKRRNQEASDRRDVQNWEKHEPSPSEKRGGEENRPRKHSDILAYAEECRIVRTPDQQPDPPRADMTKYYKYHRRHGHDTNDWRDTWGKGVVRQPPPGGKDNANDGTGNRGRPVINVIFGGGTLGDEGYVGAVVLWTTNSSQRSLGVSPSGSLSKTPQREQPPLKMSS
nr:uncharacterized protein LOC109171091 [Ipomoea batatas]